jgi:type I restriction enzyme S subunit
MPEYWGGAHYWVTPKDLSSLNSIYIKETPERITDSGLKNSSAEILPIGSVLFSSRAPIGHIAITSTAMCTNQGFKSFIPGKSVDALYLYFCLKYHTPELQALGNGATFKEVSKRVVEEYKISLPPLATQQHIARVLEQADQLRKQAQQMESELNQLAQALFLEMFGDPIKNPKGWVKVPISHFVEEFEGGKSVAAAGDESVTSKFRVLKISAVTWREFNPSESKPLPEDYQPEPSHFVRKGDLLFSRANTTELVGATSYVFEEYDNLLLPDKLWRFVWKNDVELSPMFIWNLFMDPSFRIELGKLSSGSGGSMKNISKGKLLPFEVIFPPGEMQKSFEKKFLKIRDEILACRRKAAECDAMFDSLMQRAFNGELTAPERKAA